ncbi:MAG: molybdate ABC transporter substrate-binding protein [Thermodesulfobacteriota bacterium]
MRSHYYYLIAIIVIAAAIVFFSFRGRQETTLLFLSGAGMKVPVNEIAANFERETGIKVQTQYDGSAILRDYILKFNTGDIFLPGDKKNLEILAEKGLVAESTFIAWHVVSILVAPEAKERIKGLVDLAKPGVRIAMSSPKLASLGRIVTKNVIEKHPKGQDILKNVVVYGSSSQDVLKLYRKGGIDAIIEWDVMAATPEGRGLVVVPLEKPYMVRDELFAGLLTTSREPRAAKEFYDYLITNGKEVFRKHGYNIEAP